MRSRLPARLFLVGLVVVASAMALLGPTLVHGGSSSPEVKFIATRGKIYSLIYDVGTRKLRVVLTSSYRICGRTVNYFVIENAGPPADAAQLMKLIKDNDINYFRVVCRANEPVADLIYYRRGY